MCLEIFADRVVAAVKGAKLRFKLPQTLINKAFYNTEHWLARALRGCTSCWVGGQLHGGLTFVS